MLIIYKTLEAKIKHTILKYSNSGKGLMRTLLNVPTVCYPGEHLSQAFSAAGLDSSVIALHLLFGSSGA